MAALGSFAPTETARATPTTTRVPPRAPGSASPAASSDRTITITLTEDELTTAAQSYTPMTVSGITVTNPRIRLDPGRLTLTATGRAFIVSGPIVVVASPVVTNGTAGARIESATFAGFGLPDSTKQDIADTFARTLAANIPAGVRVTTVTVSSGTLVVQAMPG
ncbi:MAG TPA: LmeA family phospholipid-binding protein [Candidatus Limnocylindria bacterium]|nr:LmeA family phospholipid-binding protein [Candidatus Limnocylindria bacterium]